MNIDAFYFQNAEADKSVEVDFPNQTILFSSASGRGGSKIAEIRQMSGAGLVKVKTTTPAPARRDKT